MSKKILCIGGAGQLGQAIIKSLLPHQISNIDFNKQDDSYDNFLLDPKISPA